MHTRDILPLELQKRCLKSDKVVLGYEDALKALDVFVQAQWAVVSWDARIPDEHGDLRSVSLPPSAPRWELFDWRHGEPWEQYATRKAQECKAILQQMKSWLDQGSGAQEHPLYIRLDALGPHPYGEKIAAIHQAYFSERQTLRVQTSTQSVPLVLATVRKSTHSFSQGQRVYIYDVYWGMNDRALVIGQFRRKHRWIKGACPIASLDNFRPTVVFHPSVVKKLSEECSISYALFERFLPMPL